MFSFIVGTRSEKCFKFAQNDWKEFTNLKETRLDAAAIVFEDDFHIFGGFGEGARLKTTEIVSANGVVSYGPNMTTELSGHAITNLNKTLSIISGGYTNSRYSTSQTFYYNHKTRQFSDGPTLLQARYSHASATIFGKHSIY